MKKIYFIYFLLIFSFCLTSCKYQDEVGKEPSTRFEEAYCLRSREVAALPTFKNFADWTRAMLDSKPWKQGDLGRYSGIPAGRRIQAKLFQGSDIDTFGFLDATFIGTDEKSTAIFFRYNPYLGIVVLKEKDPEFIRNNHLENVASTTKDNRIILICSKRDNY